LDELESMVNDKKGVFLEFSKAPPQEAEEVAADPKKKGAPAKGKAPGEELKPTFGKAWVDFTPFVIPGGKESEQRVFIQTVHPKKEEKGEDAPEEPATEELGDVFEESQTYIHIKISLTSPINPPLEGEGAIKFHKYEDLTAKMPDLQGFPGTKDAVEDFRR
jgi:hypothetical protein